MDANVLKGVIGEVILLGDLLQIEVDVSRPFFRFPAANNISHLGGYQAKDPQQTVACSLFSATG